MPHVLLCLTSLVPYVLSCPTCSCASHSLCVLRSRTSLTSGSSYSRARAQRASCSTCSRAQRALCPMCSRALHASCPACSQIPRALYLVCSYTSRASCSACSSAPRVTCHTCSCASRASFLTCFVPYVPSCFMSHFSLRTLSASHLSNSTLILPFVLWSSHAWRFYFSVHFLLLGFVDNLLKLEQYSFAAVFANED